MNGYQVTIDCKTALTSAQACQITAADIRVTPGVSTGVNSNPPPPELRPIDAELALCERYFWLVGNNGLSDTVIGMAGGNGTTNAQVAFTFPRPMRAVPTVSFSAQNILTVNPGSNVSSALSSTFVSPASMFISATISSGTNNAAGLAFFTSGTAYMEGSAEL